MTIKTIDQAAGFWKYLQDARVAWTLVLALAAALGAVAQLPGKVKALEQRVDTFEGILVPLARLECLDRDSRQTQAAGLDCGKLLPASNRAR